MSGQKRVLLVEDDDALREVVGECLRLEGYLVDPAVEGRQALARAAAHAPDAVILDLVMPGLDGWGFLRQFRAQPVGARVPVVVTTGAALEPEQAVALGVSAVVVKPFDMDRLLQLLAATLAAAEASAAPA